MTVKQTSLSVYEKIKSRMSLTRGKVFASIYASCEPICDYQIAQALNWQHHCVTPRRGELETMGYIRIAFVAPGPPYQNEVAYWVVDDECLADGWNPKPLPSRRKPRSNRPISVHEASMVLVEHRRRLRANRKNDAMPLFGKSA